jgi:hypothetical protein
MQRRFLHPLPDHLSPVRPSCSTEAQDISARTDGRLLPDRRREQRLLSPPLLSPLLLLFLPKKRLVWIRQSSLFAAIPAGSQSPYSTSYGWVRGGGRLDSTATSLPASRYHTSPSHTGMARSRLYGTSSRTSVITHQRLTRWMHCLSRSSLKDCAATTVIDASSTSSLKSNPAGASCHRECLRCSRSWRHGAPGDALQDVLSTFR